MQGRCEQTGEETQQGKWQHKNSVKRIKHMTGMTLLTELSISQTAKISQNSHDHTKMLISTTKEGLSLIRAWQYSSSRLIFCCSATQFLKCWGYVSNSTPEERSGLIVWWYGSEYSKVNLDRLSSSFHRHFRLFYHLKWMKSAVLIVLRLSYHVCLSSLTLRRFTSFIFHHSYWPHQSHQPPSVSGLLSGLHSQNLSAESKRQRLPVNI